MKLTGLHLLLTYQCTLECDHCFVWGSPRQTGVMTLEQVEDILTQAKEARTIEWIYFEGGEPFLYYPILLKGARAAARFGFQVGIVSNAYWATTKQDAVAWLSPFAELVQDLSLSNDIYHWGDPSDLRAQNAQAAASELDITVGCIHVAQPEVTNAATPLGQLPLGESAVMYRGRAAEKLAGRARSQAWDSFTQCPHENLRDPGRVHVDPFGNVHICHGITLGNLFEKPLSEISESYDPDSHPITSALLAGGPAELVRRFDLAHGERYADACHLCDSARRALRPRFAETLAPDQMYG